ncbi:MAG: hypothetical protein ACJAYB_003231 [Psychromonas sp.]|jgi:hypothetical protein
MMLIVERCIPIEMFFTPSCFGSVKRFVSGVQCELLRVKMKLNVKVGDKNV